MVRVRKEMSEDYKMCMLFKHAMDPYIPGPGEYSGPGWGNTFHLLCVRCGTMRHVTIDSLGEVSTSHYDHPPEYKKALKERREWEWTPDDLRLDYMKRMRAERKARNDKNGARKLRAVK